MQETANAVVGNAEYDDEHNVERAESGTEKRASLTEVPGMNFILSKIKGSLSLLTFCQLFAEKHRALRLEKRLLEMKHI